MTIVYPPASASLITSILMTHESGHYYSALLRDGNPNIPVMIPVVIGAVGITRVRNLPTLSKRAKRYVIASGPVSGITAAIACAPVVILFGGKTILITLCGITIVEVYNGIFGSDGKKWRMEREHYGMA